MLERQLFEAASNARSAGACVPTDEMPPIGLKRWTPYRKAQVVEAIRQGLCSADEACNRYDLTAEELACWQRRVERGGVAGLRATRIQDLPPTLR